MDKQTIERINELCETARQRIEVAAYSPGLQYAEILWMTQQEASELLQLRMKLPSLGQEAFEARSRIICKITKRRILKASKRSF